MVNLERKQIVLAAECVKQSIRESEQNERADTSQLYDLQTALLAALVGEDTASSLTTYEGPMELSVPRSWAEIEETMMPLGKVPWTWFKGCARACPAYGAEGSFMRFCAGIALQLRNQWSPDEFPFILETDVMAEFSRSLAGLAVSPVYTDDERNLLGGN